MRNCIQFQINGLWLRGTCHEPPDASDARGVGRTGVLFGNSGWLPRSGRGDLYAHLGDALAQNGYWVFRFDMPGLGDSDGEVPTEPAELLHMVQVGEHGPVFGAIATELKKQYGLENIILGGHCGSAMSAVYAALSDNQDIVSGLMLIEIGFYAVPRGSLARPPEGRSASPWRNSLAEARFAARRLILNAPGRHVMRAIYRRGLTAMQRFLGLRLPINTNTKLIEAWRRVTVKRLPTFIVSAQHPTIRPPFDFLAYLKVDQEFNITTAVIERTTHSLLEGNGKAALKMHCEAWLREHFPQESLATHV